MCGSIPRPRNSITSCCRRSFPRQPQHRRVRQGRRLLVHRTERRARLRQSQDRQARKLEVAAPRQLRHHGDAGQRRLVRGAGRRSPRQDRQGDRQRRDRRAAQEGRRPAPRLVGFQGPAVGQLLAFRRGRPLRSGGEDVEDVAASRQSRQRLLRGLCRRPGQGLAHRFPDQRHRPLRSRDGESSRASRAISAAPRCARCSAGRAKSGARNPAPTGAPCAPRSRACAPRATVSGATSASR